MLRADLLSCVPASSSESEVFAGENNFLPLFSAVRYLTNNLPRESSATSFSTDALPDLPNLQNGEAVAPPTPGPGLLLGFIWEPLSTESSVLSKTPSSVKKAGFHAMLFLRLKPPSFFFLFVETVPSARSVLFSWSWQMFSLSQVSMGSGGESDPAASGMWRGEAMRACVDPAGNEAVPGGCGGGGEGGTGDEELNMFLPPLGEDLSACVRISAPRRSWLTS